ncbi:MAG: 3-hydroxyacyl-CoA dehydrogenase family protein [Lachnospiraceae bacterium]
MEIKTVGVVGAGTMGAGIAQVVAAAGYKVIIRDIKQEFVDGAIQRMNAFYNKSIEKGKMNAEEKDAVMSRISGTDKVSDLAEADLILEAVLEDVALKNEVFSELNKVCRKEVIFASNTSSLSITQIASGSGRPDRFCGIHFFNPVPLMKLVEVIHGMNTKQATIDEALAFAKTLGKTAVEVKKDSPGFIVNRLLVPYLNEAVKMLAEGVASVEDIDTAIKLGLNYPMGPFQMIDMAGVPLTIDVLEYFSKEFNCEQYAPQPLLRQMVRAEKTGQKCGEGFYNYRPN